MYATVQDIVDRHGEAALLVVADRDDNGMVDPAVVGRALTDATSEIDTYLSLKYDLPLAEVPPVLVRICVDIAMYRLSPDAETDTDERRQRYEDAVDLLKRLATRTARLDLAETDGDALPRTKRVQVKAPDPALGGFGLGAY